MTLRLRELREAKHLSMRRVACELGVSHNAVWQWENGACGPRDKRMDKLAQLYDVKPEVVRKRCRYEQARRVYRGVA
jgi:transcriptional regulator with XRE-family HTH domain